MDISIVILNFLTSEGYNVHVAGNGLIALEKIKKFGVPQLIVLDMMMPQMNGCQFTEEFFGI